MPIEIRQATESDLPAILDMYRQPDMDSEALPIEEAKSIFQNFSQNPNHLIYVACEESSVIGSFCILVIPMLSRNSGRMGILEDVVVRSDQQGKGVGKMMMLFANQKCKELGCYKIMLSSALSREKTHRFYEGLGFTKHGYSFYLDTM